MAAARLSRPVAVIITTTRNLFEALHSLILCETDTGFGCALAFPNLRTEFHLYIQMNELDSTDVEHCDSVTLR